MPNQRPGSDWLPTIPAGTISSQSNAPTETETEEEKVFIVRELIDECMRENKSGYLHFYI